MKLTQSQLSSHSNATQSSSSPASGSSPSTSVEATLPKESDSRCSSSRRPAPATAEEVRYKYTYDPETGILRYNYNSGNRKAGDQVGWLGGNGYHITKLNGREVYVHQIIWLMMIGSWPTEDIDHKNLNKLDNSWENLRHGSHSTNCYNNPASKKKDYGVYWSKAKGKWRVQTWENGKAKHHGYFHDKEEAIQVAQRVIACRQV
jgi:hypothetical protein